MTSFHPIHPFILTVLLYLSILLPFSSSHSLLRNQKTESNHRYGFMTSRDARETASIAKARSELSSKGLLQNQEHQHRHRRSDQEEGDNDDCSLCQGLELLTDKEPSPIGTPGMTCNDFDSYYRFMWPEPTNLTVNNVGTCRSDLGYNFNTELCCRASIPRYECEQNIHDLLFGDNQVRPYNTAVPPVKSVDEPLYVSVRIEFQALEDIEVEEGTATIFVGVTMKWNDPRLVWDVVDSSTCSNSIDVFTGQEIEKTMIWLPDFDLMNQVDGFQSTPDFKATIYSDGTVEWVVAGGVKAFCAFTGLVSIPFDTLGCQLFFGAHARVYSKSVQYVLEIPDIIGVGAFELKYNEWTLDPQLTRQGYAFDGSGIYYDVFFNRATQHYVRNIVVPTILLTYLGFFTFLLDLRVGERLGFGMTMALVVVAQQIVTTGLSPVSNQKLWLEQFVAFSFYWLIYVIIQSVLIGFLFYKREDYQANKENKLISTMLSYGQEREALMKRIDTEDKAEEAEEEETNGPDDPQAENIPEETENAKETFLYNIAPEKIESTEEIFIYTFSLRKFDIACFIFAFVTYTVFVIFMLWAARSGWWERNMAVEPRWFNESDFFYPTNEFNASDPNN